MILKFRRALGAGAAGGVAAIIVVVVAAWLLHFDRGAHAAMSRGVLAVMPWPGWLALAGCALAGGMTLAVGYALVFELVTRCAGATIGAVIGVAHAAAVWVGIGLFTWFFPQATELLADELSVLFNSGAAITGFVIAHIVYGAVVGALYGAPRRRPEVKMTVTWQELHPTNKRLE